MSEDEFPTTGDTGKSSESSAADGGPRDPRRRQFLGAGIGVLGAGLGAAVLVPAVPYVLYPLGHKIVEGTGDFIPAGKLPKLKKPQPVLVELRTDTADAWNRHENVKIGSAWVVQLGGELVAYSSVCPHLGCSIGYDPKAERFRCPCHDSAFTLDGEVLGGPSPRGLDRLDVKVEDKLVKIRYQRFKQGIEDKEPV